MLPEVDGRAFARDPGLGHLRHCERGAGRLGHQQRVHERFIAPLIVPGDPGESSERRDGREPERRHVAHHVHRAGILGHQGAAHGAIERRRLAEPTRPRDLGVHRELE